MATLLETYMLEKAIYELGYEMSSRPDWAGVPLQGVLDILGPR
jgi:maltose alpha-D-glucosyltransferase/alpha-amylase